MIAGLIGMSAHYSLKWARGEIKQNPFCYVVCNFRTIFLSICTYVGVSVGLVAGDAFIGELGGFVGWKFVFWTGITNGFTIDAIVNRTERSRWTIEERVDTRRRNR